MDQSKSIFFIYLFWPCIFYHIFKGAAWSKEEKCCSSNATVCWRRKERFIGLLEISSTWTGFSFFLKIPELSLHLDPFPPCICCVLAMYLPSSIISGLDLSFCLQILLGNVLQLIFVFVAYFKIQSILWYLEIIWSMLPVLSGTFFELWSIICIIVSNRKI